MSASTLPATWDIPATIRNRLGNKAGRQRLMTADNHVLLVLHAPPKPDELERTGRFFWRNAAGDWTAKEMGPGIRSLGTHVEQYEEAIATLDRMENQATTIDEYFRVLEHLAPLHRSTRNLYQVLDEARKACPEDRELINLRDRAYAADRNAELLFDETKNSLDFAMARRADENARSTYAMEVAAHRLNVLAAFFFPIATLTAIFGVNLHHGYEQQFVPYPFLATIVAGLCLGILLTAFVARRPASRREKKSTLSKYS